MLHIHLPFPQSILFDLDNTLIDADTSCLVVLRMMIEVLFAHSNADELNEIRQQAQGIINLEPFEINSVLHLLLLKLSPTHPTTIDDLRAYWDTIYINHVQPMKDLFATLHSIHEMGIKLGIITNGTKHEQNKKIATLGIRPLLDVIIISEVVGYRKPDPGIFQIALSKLDLKASDVWFVGDNPVDDIEGSSLIGMTPIWMNVDKKWTAEHLPSHYQISSLAELPILLQGIHRDNQ
jgi:putative hydrolase of the HAD superfamily